MQGEAAIEFIKFNLYNKKFTDSIMYAALILLPGDSIPKFIPLFEEKQLAGLLREKIKAPLIDFIQGPLTIKNNYPKEAILYTNYYGNH